MATMTRLAVTVRRPVWTIAPVFSCTIRCTGELSWTRSPSAAATRSATNWVPPMKRDCCAPLRVSKLRSNVPAFCSLPEAAM